LKYHIALLILFGAARQAFPWGWVSPYFVKMINFDNTSNQIQFAVSNPSNSSDPNLGYTFIYDCDQSGNSWDGCKSIQSMLLTSIATGQKIGFDAQIISGSSWEVRQFKAIGN
jgi:hypothetical protein